MDMAFGWHTMRQKMLVVDYWMEQQKAICCLCEDEALPMDPYRRQHDSNPFAATIEHLIPKRDGGPNVASNVRMAHKMCNSALGSLWTGNQLRKEDGLAELSVEWALTRVRQQYGREIALRLALQNGDRLAEVHPSEIAITLSSRPAPPGFIPEKRKGPMPSTLAAAVERGQPINRPRGATLPGYVEPDDTPAPRLAPRPKDLLDRKGKPGRRLVRPVCTACGSLKVTMDASLSWDPHFQNWAVSEKRDTFECQSCEADAKVRWETVT